MDSSGEREFRGVWVATVANIDWPMSSDATSAQQQRELTSLLDTLKGLNFNAVILQIRPAADALYASSYDPWSTYLTGQQGRAPNPYWDPLATAVSEAHQRGMELHAWFNPYSVGLASNHIAKQLPQYAYAYGPNLWMDPGSKSVQNRTLDTILDVVTRYDIDGVHFDDYFYPYKEADRDFPDDATYNEYLAEGGHLSRDLWRHQNVDFLIEELSRKIKEVCPWVKFGISPFGIWMSGHPRGVKGFSSNTELFADSRKWLMEGWVDYMVPQLYWAIDPPQQSFTALSDWWIQQNSRHRHLYMGCATYKIASSSHLWPNSEIERQVEETRARRNKLDLGNVFFSAKYYRDNTHGIADVFSNDVNPSPALAPSMSWLMSDLPVLAPLNVFVSSDTLSWTPSADPAGRLRAFALYREEEVLDGHSSTKQFRLHQVLGRDTRSIQLSSPGRYALTAVDRLARESDATVFHVDPTLVG
ncbi:hypothetical protein ACOMHN_000518 [Nucella lapillus]